MTTTCPNGHESEWADWCSVCGERLADAQAGGDAGGTPNASPAATAPDPASTPDPDTAAPAEQPDAAATGPTCDNCGAVRRERDVFCENCGYDFASGSLPQASVEADTTAAPDVAPVHARVVVDPDFFAASVGDVDLTLPDPIPDAQVVPLAGTRILIGRQSSSRGIFPEIDVQALTGDPAVSSRHAMLERDPAGNWTVTDLGSTNGTFPTPAAETPIATGTALPLAIGTRIYLGAWTSIELAAS